jgi:hypothetical protein
MSFRFFQAFSNGCLPIVSFAYSFICCGQFCHHIQDGHQTAILNVQNDVLSARLKTVQVRIRAYRIILRRFADI